MTQSNPILAAIFGLESHRLGDHEKAFFRDVNPWGFILFARNIKNPDQVRTLTEDIRETVGRNCLIFIDQEGGRVQRLKPPHWFDYPSAANLTVNYAQDPKSARRAVFLQYRLIAHDLRALGINANCAPVLDLPLPHADPIISDRAFGTTPAQVIDLGHAVMAGLMEGGVAPVIKHIPGHGRALVDSHLELPRVETEADELWRTDFLPFKSFKNAPMAMTAHVVYDAIDSQTPVTQSWHAITGLIRGKMEYDGLIMSDDLDMKALQGGLDRKTAVSLAAGCDIALQCSGDLPSMIQVAKVAKPLMGASLERARIADASAGDPKELDVEAARAEFISLVPALSAMV